ncbi:uncharacterized protein PGTG_03083 [Puccinia graminis f. sp. tritici CRL 75-36-700-3]|uniref:Uncharacterized protein n=1 Tax=Puccinia graminis f. sp. tritici (strain CRL 75-36-700-3 / race SCCL) TaxID=418459 RepID=E3JYK2_PUCGT|nr:uncharacterized protein PGTG_03083 [Puccinia graminis f. sp. tritici CRL 75-36-700-3]EFP77127.1 hypothetical protein PGTG_03083 [Puccinia graminis f. sp. tritici CRL 75-36-700-3]
MKDFWTKVQEQDSDFLDGHPWAKVNIKIMRMKTRIQGGGIPASGCGSGCRWHQEVSQAPRITITRQLSNHPHLNLNLIPAKLASNRCSFWAEHCFQNVISKHLDQSPQPKFVKFWASTCTHCHSMVAVILMTNQTTPSGKDPEGQNKVNPNPPQDLMGHKSLAGRPNPPSS